MRVEETLIDLGDRPLTKSPYSKLLLTFLNASLPSEVKVTKDMSGHELLEKIYTLRDNELQERILKKELGNVRGKDTYRLAVLVFSAFFGLLAVLVAIVEIIYNGGNDTSSTATTIIDGILDTIRIVLGS